MSQGNRQHCYATRKLNNVGSVIYKTGELYECAELVYRHFLFCNFQSAITIDVHSFHVQICCWQI
jgi:hypothetical protein